MNSIIRRVHLWQGALTRFLLPLLLGLTTAAHAAPTPDRLTLLIPDGSNLSSWQIKVWVDSAAEEGIRLDLITDSALLALGNTAAAKIAGLVVPDSAHIRASDAVIAAITQYAYTGGQLMLVYDAGSQTDTGFFPTATNSRFANLVGVDYVFWQNGLGAATMVGFGPVVGTRGRLDALSLPPGKYLPYTTPASLTAAPTTAAFVTTTVADPSGSDGMANMMRDRAANTSLGNRRWLPLSLSEVFGPVAQIPRPLRFNRRNANASSTLGALTTASNGADYRAARLSSSGSSYTELAATTGPSTDPSPYVISGYLFGPLGYYHYVTTGVFPGTVWLSSPDHGLVAGTRTYGSGKLLFVNIPLGYFKAIGTDAAPLQGFLSAFARDQVGIATLSTQPKGKGGLIYNWHIDNNDQINDDARYLLNTTRIFNRGPYSIHFTAGPDVDYVGDRIGVNLNGDSNSRDILRRLGNEGLYGSILNFNKLPEHEIGAHGGWIHNYWAENASETNAATFTNYLQLNYDAVNNVTGDKLREYSSPGGNTPTWAINWLENKGVVAMYLVGDVGSGMVRSWRNGARLTNKLWSSPVTPQGPYATWEEFDENGVPDSLSGQWLLDLQSFVMNRRTNRLFYNHAPGARAHLKPINALLTRSDQLQSQGLFAWYTMSQLADFSQRRIETTWTTTTSSGRVVFTASHATTLTDMTWLLPKSDYSTPVVTNGWGSVSSDSRYWIVTAVSGKTLTFSSQMQ